MTDIKDKIGVIYLAFGYEYVVQAIQSACSLKSIHPKLSITIVTNIPLKQEISSSISYNNIVIGPKLFDKVVHIKDTDESNRNYKTSINTYSPYEKTLFLDSDTIIKDKIISGFKILDYADLAALYRPTASGPMVDSWAGEIHVKELDIDTISSFYSGVIFFNSDTTEDFFDKWNKKYELFGYNFDQFSFTHSIITSDIKFLPIPASWNAMDGHMKSYERFDDNYNFKDNIKIRHKHYNTTVRSVRLRKIEHNTAKHFLDVDDRNKRQQIREKFSEKYSYKEIIKSKIGKSKTARTIHEFIFG